MKTTPLGPDIPRQRRQATSPAAAGRKQGLRLIAGAVAGPEATAEWPQRPNPGVLSERIPLFFISRDDDGFWLARHADLPIGGLFFSQRSAINFAKGYGGATPCATMILSESHKLDTENRGNRFAAQLRPVKRLLRRLPSKLFGVVGPSIAKARSIGARTSRARVENRALRRAMKVDLYCGQYKHTNKNDDDLPMVR